MTTKRCTGCFERQQIENFPVRGSEKGRTSRCKTCRRLAQRDYRRRHAVRDRALMAERRRDPEVRRKAAIAHRLRKYGLSEAAYDALLIGQAGRCAICVTPMDNPQVDHCHSSDTVRGLLCGRCNRAIGLLQDDPAHVQSALLYLTR